MSAIFTDNFRHIDVCPEWNNPLGSEDRRLDMSKLLSNDGRSQRRGRSDKEEPHVGGAFSPLRDGLHFDIKELDRRVNPNLPY